MKQERKPKIKSCFIICPIGAEESEIRKKSDKILKHVYKPVLQLKNYQCIRADEIPDVGMINLQIMKLILESDLVIADLTDYNPNVFYELAIRHATGKPYIQVIAKGQVIPFDINGIRTIEIDIRDLDSVERAKVEISNQINSFEKGHTPDSPISVARTHNLLQNDEEFAAKIAENLSSLSNYEDWGMCPPIEREYSEIESKIIEKIDRKLWGFNEYSTINLEDISLKIDELTDALRKANNI